MSFFSRTAFNLAAFVLGTVVLGLTTGCNGLVPTASSGNPFQTPGVLQGLVHGGNQPIMGAEIKLYAAGISGYGSAGTLYATTMTSTDPQMYAAFSFTQITPGTPVGGPIDSSTNTYACPTADPTNPDPQMYIIASGGNTQGLANGANSASAFAVAIGKCSTASSVFVNMNEVTGVGTMVALQQYFNPVTESFGYPNTTQGILGFANGVAAISNLANFAVGAAVTSSVHSAVPLGATNTVNVTAKPEVNKINLVANILAACVNTTSNTSMQCATLFANALPPVAAYTSQPTADYSSITASNEDTLQALYFMMTNPGATPTTGAAARINALFGLTAPEAPFQPAYAAAPTDWTIAINYTSTSSCILSVSANTNTGKFLVGVNNAMIDDQGNFWGVSNSTSTTATGDLYQMSPVGKPLTCGLGKLVNGAIAPYIDKNGYVWVSANVAGSNGFYNLYKWNPNSGALDSTWSTGITPTSNDATEALASDINGNIFFTYTADPGTFSTTSGALYEFAGAAGVGAAPATPVKVATLFAAPLWMTTDTNGRLFISSTNLTGSTSQPIFDVYPSTATGNTNGYLTTTISTSHTYSAYGLAMGNNQLVSANGAGSGSSGDSYKWQFLTPGNFSTSPGTATEAAYSPSTRSAAGLLTPRGIAVDGAGNAWAADGASADKNYVSGVVPSGSSPVIAEISATGVAISATSTTGYGNVEGGFQKDTTMMPSVPRNVAIDPTGNVWFGLNTNSGTSITELVGAGVPVVTPLAAAAIANKQGQMP